MKLLNDKVRLALLLFLVLASFANCKKDEVPPASNTLTELIAKTPDLSLFKAAVQRSRITIFTDGLGPYTVLAPNDAAFRAIGINTEADINAIDSNALVNLLTYHVLPTTRSIIEIPTGPNAPISTQGGGIIYAAKYTNGTFINGAKIVTPDLKASNGWLHVVSSVLVPPTSNVLNTLGFNPNFKLLIQAINKAAIPTSFTGTGPITVFAPTNAAFVAGGLDSTAIANSSATTLSNILRYHIINARLFSSEFKNTSLKTVQGTNFALDVTSGAKVKGTNNPTFFSVVGVNIMATNGIIHVIDGVLRP